MFPSLFRVTAISAAVGRSSIMESWGASQGEAIHTSTFLGNPLGCAMALAAIEALENEDWPDRVAERGGALRTRLESLADRYPDVVGTIRGRGFMLGLELVRDANGREPDPALALLLTDHCREHGYLVLPSGVWGNVLAVTPPFVITDEQLEGFLEVLEIGVEKAHSSR